MTLKPNEREDFETDHIKRKEKNDTKYILVSLKNKIKYLQHFIYSRLLLIFFVVVNYLSLFIVQLD